MDEKIFIKFYHGGFYLPNVIKKEPAPLEAGFPYSCIRTNSFFVDITSEK